MYKLSLLPIHAYNALFFIIYINDLIKSSNILNYLLYANNTTFNLNLEDIDFVNKNNK